VALTLGALCATLAASGCGDTGSPRPVGANELAEAQTFPYYRIYWTGPSFDGHRLVAVDGLRSYLSKVGDGVYYGDCLHSEGILGGGNCLLPLRVETNIYLTHSNAVLGKQRNTVLRGVPATVYEEGHAIDLYSGRTTIEVFSDSYAHALRASEELRPLNAPGSASGELPPPVFCPGLVGPIDAAVTRVMANLPRHVCQSTAAENAYIARVTGRAPEALASNRFAAQAFCEAPAIPGQRERPACRSHDAG